MAKKHREDLPDIIHQKVGHRLKSAKNGRNPLFFGMGMFGTVGWAIAVPTLLGTLLGRWLDTLHQGQLSWTLTCMFIGMVSGCVVAWRWVTKKGGENE